MTARKRTASSWRTIGLAILTTILEKNPLKRLGLHAKLVVSLARVTVLAFTVADIYRLFAGIPLGWPDAAVDVTNMLAVPLLGALDRMKPETTVELAKTLIGRFGVGDVSQTRPVFGRGDREPSKYDDHRRDGLALC